MLRNGVVGVTISSLCALQAPALQRLGHDREGGPPFFGKEPARRGEEGPVGGAVAGPLASPGEHPQLMVEHGDLELPVIEARPNEQVKQPAREAIEKERQHEAQSERLQLPRQRRWSPARSNMCTPHASEVLAHLYAVRDAPTLDAARAAADRFANTFAREYPAAVACFTEDLDALLAIHRVPVRHRIRVRTTNLAERSFEEERRRTKVIPRLMSERATLKLAFATMIRSAERWCRVSVSDLERHQLKLLRIELGLDPPPTEDHATRRRRRPERTAA